VLLDTVPRRLAPPEAALLEAIARLVARDLPERPQAAAADGPTARAPAWAAAALDPRGAAPPVPLPAFAGAALFDAAAAGLLLRLADAAWSRFFPGSAPSAGRAGPSLAPLLSLAPAAARQAAAAARLGLRFELAAAVPLKGLGGSMHLKVSCAPVAPPAGARAACCGRAAAGDADCAAGGNGGSGGHGRHHSSGGAGEGHGGAGTAAAGGASAPAACAAAGVYLAVADLLDSSDPLWLPSGGVQPFRLLPPGACACACGGAGCGAAGAAV
jgi:uncharacterized membrane protein YgcG